LILNSQVCRDEKTFEILLLTRRSSLIYFRISRTFDLSYSSQRRSNSAVIKHKTNFRTSYFENSFVNSFWGQDGAFFISQCANPTESMRCFEHFEIYDSEMEHWCQMRNFSRLTYL